MCLDNQITHRGSIERDCVRVGTFSCCSIVIIHAKMTTYAKETILIQVLPYGILELSCFCNSYIVRTSLSFLQLYRDHNFLDKIKK
jgi:hypothetical protein